MNKFYKLVGQAVCYLGIWVISVAGIIWAFNQITVYR